MTIHRQRQRTGWMLPALCSLAASCCTCRQTPGPPPAVRSPSPAPALRAAPPPPARVELRYVPGSTLKLEQIVGDHDRQQRKKTRNQTRTRFGLFGTDLGSSFEHRGKLILLFGDTIGRGGGDAMGHSSTTDPEAGLELTFYPGHQGGYLRVMPDGELMRGFEVPVGGISLAGKPYIFCKRGHTRGGDTDYSTLVAFDEQRRTFSTIRELSRRPAGKLIKISAHLAPAGTAGLPGEGPRVLLWGSGAFRQSDAYLACAGAGELERPGSLRYFAGQGAGGQPRWSQRQADARPVLEHPTIGDLSVTWCAALKLWLMVYDSRAPRGIILRHAAAPWGPWSAPQIIFNARRDQRPGQFIHRRDSDDGLAGPVIGKHNRQDPGAVQGGAYAPYVIERFTRVAANKLTIYYVMSTWNPYVVVLMRSQLKIQKGAPK